MGSEGNIYNAQPYEAELIIHTKRKKKKKNYMRKTLEKRSNF